MPLRLTRSASNRVLWHMCAGPTPPEAGEAVGLEWLGRVRESALRRGGAHREALEKEVARVVSSDEWRWYTEGEHYRELELLHLVEECGWRVGAFDLYRIGHPCWGIDFKTHEIPAEDVHEAAAAYAKQVELCGKAAAIASDVGGRLHFTVPGTVIRLDPNGMQGPGIGA